MAWWTDFRVAVFLAIIETSFLGLVDYKLSSIFSFKGALFFGELGYVLTIAGLPFFINYYLFLYNKGWKDVLDYFDKATMEEKKKLDLKMKIVISLFLCLSLLLLLLC